MTVHVAEGPYSMDMPRTIALPLPTPRRRLRQRLKVDDSGAVAIEYAMLGAMTAVIAITGLTLFGDSATGLWSFIRDEISNALNRVP